MSTNFLKPEPINFTSTFLHLHKIGNQPNSLDKLVKVFFNFTVIIVTDCCVLVNMIHLDFGFGYAVLISEKYAIGAVLLLLKSRRNFNRNRKYLCCFWSELSRKIRVSNHTHCQLCVCIWNCVNHSSVPSFWLVKTSLNS